MIIMPVLVLLIFLGVQAAIYFHAANVAAAAASQGAAASSPRTAGVDAGAAAADGIIADLGADSVGQPEVSDTDGLVSVTVTIAVPRLIPFFPNSVTRTASEPRELFVPESER